MWKKPLTKSGTTAFSTHYTNTKYRTSSFDSSAASSTTDTHISKSKTRNHNSYKSTTEYPKFHHSAQHYSSFTQPTSPNHHPQPLTIRRRHKNILIIQRHHNNKKQTAKIPQPNLRLLWKIQDQPKRKQNNSADNYWTSTQIHQGIHSLTPNSQKNNSNH